MDSNNIGATEFIERINTGQHMNLLDVREPLEFHTHNVGGLNIPLGKLTEELPLEYWDTDDEIIVICKAGLRSRTAQAILLNNGYTNVRNLTGGLIGLERAKQ